MTDRHTGFYHLPLGNLLLPSVKKILFLLKVISKLNTLFSTKTNHLHIHVQCTSFKSFLRAAPKQAYCMYDLFPSFVFSFLLSKLNPAANDGQKQNDNATESVAHMLSVTINGQRTFDLTISLYDNRQCLWINSLYIAMSNSRRTYIRTVHQIYKSILTICLLEKSRKVLGRA
jgi:hypothetical protein